MTAAAQRYLAPLALPLVLVFAVFLPLALHFAASIPELFFVVVVQVNGPQALAFALVLVLAVFLPLALYLARAVLEFLFSFVIAVAVITRPAGEWCGEKNEGQGQGGNDYFHGFLQNSGKCKISDKRQLPVVKYVATKL